MSDTNIQKKQGQKQPALVKRSWFIRQREGKIEDFYEWPKKRSLGSGQFGSVVEVKVKGGNEKRAVKVIPKSRVRNPEQFLNEINILKELDHPNIVRLYEIFEDARNVYLVMELCSGGELFDLITERKRFSENDARTVFRQIASAVRHCHQHHVCHRDLKPENFLILTKDSIDNIKVADFGLSCTFIDSNANKKSLLGRIGSSFYMAPEVLKGTYSELCDSWSLGVILYILLSGVPPFFGATDEKVFERVEKGVYSLDIPQMKGVSDSAKDLIRRCLVGEAERLSVSEIVQHPWIKESDGESSGICLDFNQMKAFHSTSKLKKVTLTYIASQLSEAEITSLGNLFKELDTNGDGTLSVAEITEGVKNFKGSSESLQAIIDGIDTDSSGSIEYTEFLAASIEKSLYYQQEKLYNAFRALDADNSGSITRDELKVILGQEGQYNSRSPEYWMGLIDDADKDGNGEIDYQEFVEMMTLQHQQQQQS